MTANTCWLMRPRIVFQGNSVHGGCTHIIKWLGGSAAWPWVKRYPNERLGLMKT